MGAETGNGNTNCNNEVLDENDELNAPITPGLGGPDTNADFWATVEKVKGVVKTLNFDLQIVPSVLDGTYIQALCLSSYSGQTYILKIEFVHILSALH